MNTLPTVPLSTEGETLRPALYRILKDCEKDKRDSHVVSEVQHDARDALLAVGGRVRVALRGDVERLHSVASKGSACIVDSWKVYCARPTPQRRLSPRERDYVSSLLSATCGICSLTQTTVVIV